MPKSSIKRRNGFTLLFKSLAFDKIFLKEFCYAHQLCIYRSSNQKSDWNWMQKNPILYVFVVYIYIRSDISEQIGWQNKWRHSVRFNSCLSSSTTSTSSPFCLSSVPGLMRSLADPSLSGFQQSGVSCLQRRHSLGLEDLFPYGRKDLIHAVFIPWMPRSTGSEERMAGEKMGQASTAGQPRQDSFILESQCAL